MPVMMFEIEGYKVGQTPNPTNVSLETVLVLAGKCYVRLQKSLGSCRIHICKKTQFPIFKLVTPRLLWDKLSPSLRAQICWLRNKKTG